MRTPNNLRRPTFRRVSSTRTKTSRRSDEGTLAENRDGEDYQPQGYEGMLRHTIRSEHEDTESSWLISYSDLMTLLFGFFVMLMSFSKIDVEVYEKARKETTKYFGGEYKMAMQKVQSELQSNIQAQQLADQVHLDMDAKGVTVTFRGSLFFDSGSAEIRKEAQDLIKKILPVVTRMGSDIVVIVEGHTDDNPINDKRFPSNWELSSFRASSVLRFLESAGIPKTQLRAIGFSDTMPAFPNRDSAGKAIPENQSQNRRVVLRIIKQPKK